MAIMVPLLRTFGFHLFLARISGSVSFLPYSRVDPSSCPEIIFDVHCGLGRLEQYFNHARNRTIGKETPRLKMYIKGIENCQDEGFE
jgi:hypothetical protein